MKFLNIIAGAAAVGLGLLGVSMANTNPSQTAYEKYATQRLSEYIKDNVCDKPKGILDNLPIKIDSQCDKLLDSANPQIQEIIAKTTKRQNFIIFSIYHTDLKLESFPFIPGYKFESVGAFNNFYIYNAQQQ